MTDRLPDDAAAERLLRGGSAAPGLEGAEALVRGLRGLAASEVVPSPALAALLSEGFDPAAPPAAPGPVPALHARRAASWHRPLGRLAAASLGAKLLLGAGAATAAVATAGGAGVLPAPVQDGLERVVTSVVPGLREVPPPGDGERAGDPAEDRTGSVLSTATPSPTPIPTPTPTRTSAPAVRGSAPAVRVSPPALPAAPGRATPPAGRPGTAGTPARGARPSQAASPSRAAGGTRTPGRPPHAGPPSHAGRPSERPTAARTDPPRATPTRATPTRATPTRATPTRAATPPRTTTPPRATAQPGQTAPGARRAAPAQDAPTSTSRAPQRRTAPVPPSRGGVPSPTTSPPAS